MNEYTHQPRPPRNRLPRPSLRVLLVFVALAVGGLASQTPGSPLRIAPAQSFTVEAFNGFTDKTLPWNTSVVRTDDGKVYAQGRMVMTLTRPDSSTVIFEQLTDLDGHVRGQLYGDVVTQLGNYSLQAQMAGNGQAASDTFVITDSADPASDTTYTGDNTFTGQTTFTQAIQATGGVDTNGASVTTEGGNVNTAGGNLNTAGGNINAGTGSVTAGTFFGSGSGLTSLNASNLSSGTVADARLSTNVALLDRNTQTFTGNNQAFRNAADSATAFQVQNAAGASQLTVDTTNSKVTVTNLETTGSVTSTGSLSGTNLTLSGSGATTINLTSTTAGTGLTIGGDTNLYRSAADTFSTDDVFTVRSGGGNTVQLKPTGQIQTVYGTQSAFFGYGAQPAGPGIALGTADGVYDTNLYRSAADTLKTDDTLVAGSIFSASPAAARIGLGNTSPDYLVHVGKTATNNEIAIERTGANPSLLRLQAFGDATSIEWSGAYQRLRLIGGGNEVMSISDDGKLQFGSSIDTNLYRSAANVLQTDDNLHTLSVTGAIGTSSQVTLGASGGIAFGTANDTNLYRSAANVLKTDDSLQVTGSASLLSDAGTSSTGLLFGSAGDTNLYRESTNYLKTEDNFKAGGEVISSDGSTATVILANRNARPEIIFGLAGDTNLYRSAANQLKTDDTFDAAAYKVGGVAGASATCPTGQYYDAQAVAGGIVTAGTCSPGSALNSFVQGGNSFGGTAYLGTNDAHDLQLETGGTTKLTVQNSTGNVGIGETVPGALLHLNKLGFGTVGPQLLLTNPGATAGDAEEILFGESASDIRGKIVNTVKAGGAGEFNFLNGSTAAPTTLESRLFVADGGNVGIGETNPTNKLQLTASTAATGGIGFGTDTNLYRGSAGLLKTDNAFHAVSNISTSDSVIVDNQSAGGKLYFGSTLDTNLYRSAANTLKTDDGLIVDYLQSGKSVEANIGTANYVGIGYDSGGYVPGISFGAASDTNLYRSAADTLKTDDKLAIATLGTADTSTTLCRNTTLEVATCTSSEKYKHDIAPLGESDYADVLGKVKSTDIFRYRFNGPDTAQRTGVIAEYLPPELTPTKDDNGNPAPDWFSIYGYLWAGEKQLAITQDELAARLKQLEDTRAALNPGAAAGTVLSADATAVKELKVGGPAVVAAIAVEGDAEVKGNLKVGGTVELGDGRRGKRVDVSGETSVWIWTKGQPDGDYGVSITPRWQTTYAVADQNEWGFRVEFAERAPKGATIDWLIFR